jgi:hypothetical protein
MYLAHIIYRIHQLFNESKKRIFALYMRPEGVVFMNMIKKLHTNWTGFIDGLEMGNNTKVSS